MQNKIFEHVPRVSSADLTPLRLYLNLLNRNCVLSEQALGFMAAPSFNIEPNKTYVFDSVLASTLLEEGYETLHDVEERMKELSFPPMANTEIPFLLADSILSHDGLHYKKKFPPQWVYLGYDLRNNGKRGAFTLISVTWVHGSLTDCRIGILPQLDREMKISHDLFKSMLFLLVREVSGEHEQLRLV